MFLLHSVSLLASLSLPAARPRPEHDREKKSESMIRFNVIDSTSSDHGFDVVKVLIGRANGVI